MTIERGNMNKKITGFVPWVQPPRCDEHRPKTAAVCEMPPNHKDHHTGRDTAGRWHCWASKGQLTKGEAS